LPAAASSATKALARAWCAALKARQSDALDSQTVRTASSPAAEIRVSSAPDAAVGLCADCRFARRIVSARGSEFWRCLRADDPALGDRFPKYPRLPVRTCRGYERRDERETRA
jgi:hypothetical protein